MLLGLGGQIDPRERAISGTALRTNSVAEERPACSRTALASSASWPNSRDMLLHRFVVELSLELRSGWIIVIDTLGLVGGGSRLTSGLRHDPGCPS